MLIITVIWFLIGATALICFFSVCFYGWKSCIAFLNDNSDAIKIVFSMVAVVYAATLYHQEFVGQRVTRTLEFSEKANKSDMKKSISIINDYWLHGAGCRTLKAARLGEISNESWAISARNYVRANKLESYVVEVHKYYKELVTCVDRKRCDERTACEIFASDIENFRLTYRKFLAEWEDAFQKPVIAPLRSFKSQCLKKRYISNPENTNITPPGEVTYSCSL